MAAPRKPRADSKEHLRNATMMEALKELSNMFVVELGEHAPSLSQEECRRLYHVVGTAYRHAYGRSHPIFKAYMNLRLAIQNIRLLAEDPENAVLEGHGREILDIMVQHVLPLETSVFSAQLFSRFLISDGLDPSQQSRSKNFTDRQWFIFGTDGLYNMPFGEDKPWGLSRSPTARELALMALVAGDFPNINVGKDGDTPASVIKKMTSIMATERRRLWNLLTNGESSGPPPLDGQFDEEYDDYG